MAVFDISKDLITNLPRKVDAYKHEDFNPTLGGNFSPYIKLFCRVFYTDDKDDILEGRGISSYLIELRAENTTRVNPLTGDYLVDAQPNDGVGEYDFIKAAISAGLFTIEGFITMAVQRADSLGRFDANV